MKTMDSAEIIQSQINNLGDRIEKQFMEIKELIKSNEERLRLLEISERSCGVLVNSSMDNLEEKVKRLEGGSIEAEERMKKIEVSLDGLQNVSKWLLGIITSMIVYVVVALISKIL